MAWSVFIIIILTLPWNEVVAKDTISIKYARFHSRKDEIKFTSIHKEKIGRILCLIEIFNTSDAQKVSNLIIENENTDAWMDISLESSISIGSCWFKQKNPEILKKKGKELVEMIAIHEFAHKVYYELSEKEKSTFNKIFYTTPKKDIMAFTEKAYTGLPAGHPTDNPNELFASATATLWAFPDFAETLNQDIVNFVHPTVEKINEKLKEQKMCRMW